MPSGVPASSKRTALTVVALTACVLSACAERVSTAPDPWGAHDLILGVGRPARSLEGTTWVLRALDADTLPADAARTLRFDPGADGALALSTTVGCNRITGRAQAIGARLRLEALAQTKMACGGPLGALEARYTGLLAEAAYFGVRGDTLWVHDARFERRARYEAQR